MEFALLVPLLMVLVLGIAEFGRAYHAQTTLSQAAREGVRVMALDNSRSDAVNATTEAAKPLAVTTSQVAVRVMSGTNTITACPSGGSTTSATAHVEITYSHTYITGLFGSAVTLKGKGVMRCAAD